MAIVRPNVPDVDYVQYVAEYTDKGPGAWKTLCLIKSIVDIPVFVCDKVLKNAGRTIEALTELSKMLRFGMAIFVIPKIFGTIKRFYDAATNPRVDERVTMKEGADLFKDVWTSFTIIQVVSWVAIPLRLDFIMKVCTAVAGFFVDGIEASFAWAKAFGYNLTPLRDPVPAAPTLAARAGFILQDRVEEIRTARLDVAKKVTNIVASTLALGALFTTSLWLIGGALALSTTSIILSFAAELYKKSTYQYRLTH